LKTGFPESPFAVLLVLDVTHLARQRKIDLFACLRSDLHANAHGRTRDLSGVLHVLHVELERALRKVQSRLDSRLIPGWGIELELLLLGLLVHDETARGDLMREDVSIAILLDDPNVLLR
jgi:hypothetical protein